MKKLFFSLLLGAVIAICWVMIIHTLKWVAIRGNEFELLQAAQQANYASAAAAASASAGDEPSLRQAARLLAGERQALQVPGAELPAGAALPGEPPGGQSRRRRGANEVAAPARGRDAINKQRRRRRQLDAAAASAKRRRSDKMQNATSSSSGSSTSAPLWRDEPLDELAGDDDERHELGAAGPASSEEAPAPPPRPTSQRAREEAASTLGAPAAEVPPAEAQPQPQPPPPPIAGLMYKAPFFTSWFVSIWNILFMPVFALISSCCFRNEDSTTKKLLVESISQFMDNGLTTLQFLGRCAFFSVLWIGTIFGIVYSLAYIDATVVMALFACSAALVYLLSWVLLHQQFVGVRIVAVIICTTGIALLAYMDNSRTLGSVLIVAGSALCSAVYKVIYQRMFGFWSIAQMSLFFTLIGLFNAFLMWPIALLLYFLGVELIVWRYIPWMHLTAAGALHLTANIVAYFGPICSYDIFLTLGLLFAVALSAVIDVTFYKITFFGMKLAGVLLLMIGFLVCLLPENWNECLYELVNERFIRWKKQRSLKKSRNKVQDMSTGQMSRLRTPSGRVK